MPKRVLTGRVRSDKMSKTRVVVIDRLVRHPKYNKLFRDRTVCHMHDEHNESSEGDLVQIIESRPLSKTKHWSLLSVVEKSQAVSVAALKAARRQSESLADEVTSSEEAGS
jgi:small subunit ribosomal protein S17